MATSTLSDVPTTNNVPPTNDVEKIMLVNKELNVLDEMDILYDNLVPSNKNKRNDLMANLCDSRIS